MHASKPITIPMDGHGTSPVEDCRFAVVVSRFNEAITEGLLRGARVSFAAAGVPDDRLTVVHVPGAFELPVTARRLAETSRFDAVVCLGCLIKGETMHFEYIAAAASQGIMDVSTSTGVPIAFGLLTASTDEQAEARAEPGPGNKGGEAAQAAIDMAALFRRLARPATV